MIPIVTPTMSFLTIHGCALVPACGPYLLSRARAADSSTTPQQVCSSGGCGGRGGAVELVLEWENEVSCEGGSSLRVAAAGGGWMKRGASSPLLDVDEALFECSLWGFEGEILGD